MSEKQDHLYYGVTLTAEAQTYLLLRAASAQEAQELAGAIPATSLDFYASEFTVQPVHPEPYDLSPPRLAFEAMSPDQQREEIKRLDRLARALSLAARLATSFGARVELSRQQREAEATRAMHRRNLSH